MLTFLRVLRGLSGLIAGLQIFQMLPALALLGAPQAVDDNTAALLFIKLVLLFVFGMLFLMLRKAINRRTPQTLKSFFAL